jgi:hypothetical protein
MRIVDAWTAFLSAIRNPQSAIDNVAISLLALCIDDADFWRSGHR